LRALVDWPSVAWDERTIRLPRAGMEIDLGGIGKEYAADRVATIAIDAGIAHGYVNLAGDVRVWGGRPDGAPWRVGIRHPRVDDASIGGIEIADGAVATSGDYERFIVVDGVRYCHILDATTGWPVTRWQSMSVAAPLCRRRQRRDGRDAAGRRRAGVARRARPAMARHRCRRQRTRERLAGSCYGGAQNAMPSWSQPDCVVNC
jgi:hypothetical protein